MLIGRRTQATLAHPLVAMLEVVYADVLLPMLDTVVALRYQCGFMLEKVGGIVKQAGVQTRLREGAYEACESHLEALVEVVHEIYQTVRQLEFEMLLANQISDVEYAFSLRKTLKSELIDQMCDMIWRLSTELLKLQLAVLEVGLDGNDHEDLETRKAMRLKMLASMKTATGAGKSKKGGLFGWLKRRNADAQVSVAQSAHALGRAVSRRGSMRVSSRFSSRRLLSGFSSRKLLTESSHEHEKIDVPYRLPR